MELTGEEILKAFKDFNKAIYNFAYYRCGMNKELAEDITQETFLRAWKYRHSFDQNKSSLKTWLHVLAKNLVFDNYKKIKSRNEVKLNSDYEADTFKHEELSATSIDIQKGLAKLNESDRDLLLMRYIEELDIDEISKIIDKSNGATKVAIHRALFKLKECMNYE